MTNIDVNSLYYDWLLCQIDISGHSSYRKTLDDLYTTEFRYSLLMDKNRYEEGNYLKYTFAAEFNLDYSYVISILGEKCSVLEMMTALSMECENLMRDSDYGDRVPKWFWKMFENLGLLSIPDWFYNKETVMAILNNFMDREYDPTGLGGLFYIPEFDKDMTKAGIWYQMNWYLRYLRGG